MKLKLLGGISNTDAINLIFGFYIYLWDKILGLVSFVDF